MQQPDWRPRIPSTPQTPETSSVQGSITTSCIRETDRGSFQTIRGNDCVRTNLKSIQIKAIAQAVEDEQARILELEGPWFLSTFRPSYSAQLSLGLPPNLVFSRNFTQAAQDSSSPNYLGDLSVARNKSANIPENENCALWIMGVHPGVTHRALLAAIRGVGNVYAAVINPPRGFHSGAATKIVFFARHEAEKLFKLVRLFSISIRWFDFVCGSYGVGAVSGAVPQVGSLCPSGQDSSQTLESQVSGYIEPFALLMRCTDFLWTLPSHGPKSHQCSLEQDKERPLPPTGQPSHPNYRSGRADEFRLLRIIFQSTLYIRVGSEDGCPLFRTRNGIA